MKALQDEQKQHKFNQNEEAACFLKKSQDVVCGRFFFPQRHLFILHSMELGSPPDSREKTVGLFPSAERSKVTPSSSAGSPPQAHQSGLVPTLRCCPSKKPRALVLALRHRVYRDGAR